MTPTKHTETALEVATKSVQPKPTKTDILTAMTIALWEKRQTDAGTRIVS